MTLLNRTTLLLGALAVLSACGGQGSTGSPPTTTSAGLPTSVPPALPLTAEPPRPSFMSTIPAAPLTTSSVKRSPLGNGTPPAFFNGQVALANSIYYLKFPNNNVFGYYAWLSAMTTTQVEYIGHVDMGTEAFYDGNDSIGSIYFYDFASGHWWYTGAQFPFPYLYDFSLSAVLYYYPNTGSAGHYTKNPRYFYNFSNGQIITLPSATLTPSSLKFTAIGAAAAKTFTASESGYTGGFTINATACSGIATISAPQGDTYTVTPIGNGTCYAIVGDTNSGRAALGIQVSAATAFVPGTDGPALTGTSYDPDGDWGPVIDANSLDFLVQHGYYGKGQTVAVVMDAFPSTADINAYLHYFGITRTGTITTENVDGGPSAGNTDGVGEVTLDVETIAALAPGANIVVYGIPELDDQSTNDAFSQVETDGKASVVNYSAGGCEDPSNPTTSTPILQSGANKGMAFVASAGDDGNTCFNGTGNQYGVNYPASDPYAVGVGGTETNPPNYTLTSTTAWNDTSCGTSGGQQCATGGGVSGEYSLPSYQSGIAGVASTTKRNVPDAAMPGEDTAVYQAGWGGVNGTSWSAPQLAALISETYEYCKGTFATPTTIFYTAFKASPTAFIDIIHGNNQDGTTTPYFSAHAGYDNVSGVGVPLGTTFANTLCPGRVMASAARAPMAVEMPAVESGSGPRTLDVTRHIPGLADLGTRAATAQTRIQIVVGPEAGAEADVQQALRGAGFTITQTFGNHLVIDAQAPAALVASYFGTSMHDVTQGRYGRRYTPVTPATLPTAIAGHISGLILDNLVTMKVR